MADETPDDDIDLLSALIDTLDSEDEGEMESKQIQDKINSSKAAKTTLVSPPDSPSLHSSPQSQTTSTSRPTSAAGDGDSKVTVLPLSTNGKAKERPQPADRILEECDIFSPKPVKTETAASALAKDLFGDDSDDGDDEMISKTSLNENGMEIRKLMASREQPQNITSSGFYDKKMTTGQIRNKWAGGSRTAHDVANSTHVKVPNLGLAIVNPKISMDFLGKAMVGKDIVPLFKTDSKKADEKNGKDWITVGVITSKTETKRSSAGNEYIIFRLADMTKVDQEVSLFLFSQSYANNWKLPVGTAIGLMNPKVMKNDRPTSRSVATISIQNESQLMVIGTSKDFGICSSITKNGNKCTNIVNKSACDKCRFHVMQEHKAGTHRRAELNSAYGGREPDSVSRNRLMSKLATTKSADDCFTYGRQSFLTHPQTRTSPANESTIAQCSKAPKPKTKVSLKGVLNRSAQKGNLESTLNLYQIKPADQERITVAKEVARTKAEEKLEEFISRPTTATMQFMKHLVAKELKGGSSKSDSANITVKSVTPAELLRQQKETMDARRRQQKMKVSSGGTASGGVSGGGGLVVLSNANTKSSSATPMTAEDYRKMRAKQNAMTLVKSKGGIQKEDVNAVRKKLTNQQKDQIKRKINSSSSSESELSADSKTRQTDSDNSSEKSAKLAKLDINSEAYLAIRNRKSINTHLTQQVQEERESQYFNHLEKKEGYETKLLETHVIESTMYYCPKCDYQDWKLADRCFSERHNYKKFQAVKRFFQCNNCKERLVTHERFPTNVCKKCGGTNFGKAGMIHEKVSLPGQDLSLRGNEETRLGSYDTQLNLDID